MVTNDMTAALPWDRVRMASYWPSMRRRSGMPHRSIDSTQRIAQRRPGCHAELRKRAIQRGPDGAVRQKQPMADLPVREPRCCKRHDVELLLREGHGPGRR